MKDTDLYSQILGVKDPWFVSKVDLAVAGGSGSIKIAVEVKEGHRLPCPDCGAECAGYDTQKRTWRHLDTCQLQTLIEADVPRVNCKDHGVKLAKVPWAEKNSKFTLLFERLAIDVLQQCHITGACKILGLTWDEAWGIKARAVKRGLDRRQLVELPKIGLDEKAIAKRHRYAALVYDLETPRVLHVAEDRRETSLDGFWSMLTGLQKDSIKAVAMDMWDPFIASVRKNVPKAVIVFDRFHIHGMLSKAVDMVRRQENRELVKEDDDRLKKTKFLWLANPKNMTTEARRRFRDLKTSDLKVAKAWAMRENFIRIWSFTYPVSVAKHINAWCRWVTKSGLKPMMAVAETIMRHISNILTYLQYPITNAVAEGFNSKIKSIQSMARGFRNFHNFRIAVMFHCGGLNLYPL
jgi:transposase